MKFHQNMVNAKYSVRQSSKKHGFLCQEVMYLGRNSCNPDAGVYMDERERQTASFPSVISPAAIHSIHPSHRYLI